MERLYSRVYCSDIYGGDDIIRECYIKAQIVPYNACATGSLEEAKRSYDKFDYIGSGYVFYINGTRNINKKLHHYFISKQ